MDVRLTDEQEMLCDMAGALGADLAPASVDALGPDARASGDAAAWASLAQSGLVALSAPESLGGSGARSIDAALVVERLAGALAPVPYVGAGTWAPALVAATGAADAVAAIASGSLRLAPVLRADLRGLAHAGEPGVAFDAQGAQAGLVLDDAGALRAVALGDPARPIDLTRSMHHVVADASSVALDVGLGAPLPADALARVEAFALAALAADLVGVMQAALDAAVAYVKERVQFGVVVGSFQAVQHLAAHAAVLVEGARSSMWHGAWAVDELAPHDALLAARQAKAFASEAARTVGETAIQMFGGIGLTWEELAHVRQRRLLTTRTVLGDEQVQYAAIATTRLGAAGRA